jgi:hypothetical protein
MWIVAACWRMHCGRPCGLSRGVKTAFARYKLERINVILDPENADKRGLVITRGNQS